MSDEKIKLTSKETEDLRKICELISSNDFESINLGIALLKEEFSFNMVDSQTSLVANFFYINPPIGYYINRYRPEIEILPISFRVKNILQNIIDQGYYFKSILSYEYEFE